MNGDPKSDDYLEIELRDPLTIARRILVLDAVVERAAIEAQAESGELSPDIVPEMLFDLRATLMEAGAEGELTQREAGLIATPAGSLAEDDLARAGLEIEALAALLESNGLVKPRLAHLAPVPANAIFAFFDAHPEISARKLADLLDLPSEEDAALMREISELWHWRLAMESVSRDSGPDDRFNLRQGILETAAQAQDAGLLERDMSGDFATPEKPVTAMSDDEVAVAEVAFERQLHAMNWLCGFGENWDETPLEL